MKRIPAIEAPILVIGTHRSGTTMLGRALAHHPQVAYWEEPRHVWSWGHNYRRDDRLIAADATPRIQRHIRTCFSRFLQRSGRPRVAEKTPSNCLRLPFIDRVFPDALYLHIFRDGRAVVSSTDIVNTTSSPEREWYLRRLLGTPMWEWPAFVPRAWRTLGRRLLGREMAYWGPQPPGWRDWLAEDSAPLAVLAKQWRHTLEPVLEFRPTVEPGRWLDLRYEDVVSDPGRAAAAIQDFARLEPSPDFVRHVEEECDPSRAGQWRARRERFDELRPILEPALVRLGYSWDD